MNSEIEAVRTLTGLSFRHFVEIFWQCVSGDKFRPGLIVDALCEHLQAVKEGKLKRLAIACPIRHGKSLITSVLFPAWLWIHDPSLRILTVSCGERNANRDSLRTRQLIQSSLYQACFGNLFTLTEDQNAKSYFANDHKGTRVALGTGSNTAGQDADVIIADDILDYDRAKSEAERDNTKDYWEGTLSQRLALGNGKDRLLLVGHRVHEDDVFAHIWNTFGNSGEWSYLVLPAEAQPEITNGYHNGIGWIDERHEGELLNPERFPLDVIASKKKELRHKYYCLFQQDPSPATGDLFRSEWFRYYDSDGIYYDLDGRRVAIAKAWRFATVDTAVTTGAHSDYTVCQVFDLIGSDLVLVHQLRKRLDGSRIIPALAELVKLYQPQFVVVEKEFVGQFVIDQLRALDIPVKAFKAKGHGDKLTRAVAAEIRLEAGRVWFPRDASYVPDLRKEILAFPHSAHDDQVDCLSMACITADKYHGRLEPELTPEQIASHEERKARERFEAMLNAGTPF